MDCSAIGCWSLMQPIDVFFFYGSATYVKYSIANILCLYYMSSLSVLVTRAAGSDSLQLGGLLSILRQHSSLLHLHPLSPEEIKQVHETVIAVTTGRY